MFEGESADKFAETFPHLPIWGRAKGLAHANLGAMTPIGLNGNVILKNKTY
jgi:hypothetical protein